MWEQGGIAQVGHVYVKQAENLEDGTFDLIKLEKMISDHTDRCCSATKVFNNKKKPHPRNNLDRTRTTFLFLVRLVLRCNVTSV